MTPQSQLGRAIAAFERGELDRARQIAEALPASEAPAAHLLGLIHCRSGDYALGIASLRRASDIAPANPEYRFMLVRALIDSGRADEALAVIDAADNPPPRTPAGLAFLHVRAEALNALGDKNSAAAAWQSLTDARPQDWRAWSSLGNARAALQQWPAAVEALRRASALDQREPAVRRDLAAALAAGGGLEESLEQLIAARALDPSHGETHLALARLLADLDRHEEALAAFAEAEKSGAKPEDVSLGRGRSLVALMRFEEAEQVYRAAIARAPADATATHELGLLLERTGRIDDVRALVDTATANGVAAEDLAYLSAAVALRDGCAAEAKQLLMAGDASADPVRWHYLMARIEDALGHPDAAFDAASAMNRATPGYEDWLARGLQYCDRLRALAPAMTRQWAGRLKQLPPPQRRTPAFLVGFPRSGTTLLDTFLMGHPDTAVLEEVNLLGAAEAVAGPLLDLPDCTEERLTAARDAYFKELDRHLAPGFGGLVVDKLPLNMLGMPLIHSLFPGAKIIFAQRHPCDVVLSGFMQRLVLNEGMACFLEIDAAADLYDVAMSAWFAAREVLPLDVHTLVYEELVADPATALRPLIDFLGLEWREELLDHQSTAHARGMIVTPSYDQVTRPLTRRPVGRWRQVEHRLQSVLPKLLPWAERLGY